jgi:hypothetical protein
MEDLSLSSDFYKYDLPVNRMCFAKQSSWLSHCSSLPNVDENFANKRTVRLRCLHCGTCTCILLHRYWREKLAFEAYHAWNIYIKLLGYLLSLLFIVNRRNVQAISQLFPY